MKIRFKTNDFLKFLKKGSPLIEQRPIIPILENVLLVAEDDNVTMRFCNIKSEMIIKLECCDVDEVGSICVPYKILSDTLSNLPNEYAFLESENNQNGTLKTVLRRENGAGSYIVNGENPIDFPKSLTIESTNSFVIPREEFDKIPIATKGFTGTDDLRPSMTGVNIKATGANQFNVAATDSRILVVLNMLSNENVGDINIILPKNIVSLISQILDKDDNEIRIEYNKENVRLEVKNITVIARLIDERYPDYENVIPLDNGIIAEVEISSFLESLKRVSIFADKTSNKIAIHFKSDKVILSAEDADFENSASENLEDIISYNDEREFKIGFNNKLLQNACENLEKLGITTCDFCFNDNDAPKRAVILRKNNSDVTMLIMPLLLNEYSY